MCVADRTCYLHSSYTFFRRDVAQFVNSYPSIEVAFSIDEAEGGYNASTPITVRVTLDREADDDAEDADQSVIAPHYPGKKIPNFWLILATGKTLQGIKKVRFETDACLARMGYVVSAVVLRRH